MLCGSQVKQWDFITNTMKVNMRSLPKWHSSFKCLSFRSFSLEASITLSVRTSIFAYFGVCEAFFSWLTAPWRALLRKIWFCKMSANSQAIRLYRFHKFTWCRCLSVPKLLFYFFTLTQPVELNLIMLYYLPSKLSSHWPFIRYTPTV